MAARRAGPIAERGAVWAIDDELCDASRADCNPAVEAQGLAPGCGCMALVGLARWTGAGRGVGGGSADLSAWNSVSFRCSEAALVYRRGDEGDVVRARDLSGRGGSVRLRRGQAALGGNGVGNNFFCCAVHLATGNEHLRQFSQYYFS